MKLTSIRGFEMNIFSKFITIVFIAGSLPAPTQASGYECESGPKSEWMPKESILKSLAAQGYKVRKVEVEDGCYEVYALKDGKKYEVFVNPATGVIKKIKEK